MSRTAYEQNIRRKAILDRLMLEGSVYAAALSEELGVNAITIRRDLAEMEEQGQLKRFHGGAVLPDGNVKAPAVADGYEALSAALQKFESNGEKKDLIAEKAAAMVNPGEVIFLNSGTTGLHLLPYLEGKNVRIVTNSALIALLPRSLDTEITIAGGEHFPGTQSYVGHIAKTAIENAIATKCFLSVSGISADRGITCSRLQETEINNTMISQCSGQRIVIADGSKIGRAYNFISCGLKDVDVLITDSSADPDELEKLRHCGLKIILAEEE